LDELRVDVSHKGKKDEIAVITAKGYIDTTTKDEIERVLLNILAKKKYKLIVNLKDVDYINSSGWGVFLREIKDIRENKGDIVLINMSPDVYSVFETMELSHIIRSFDSMKAAVSHFSADK